MKRRIGIIGGGAWGTALAQHLARAGHAALLWAREPDAAAAIEERHENALFLPGVTLDPRLRATNSLAALADCEIALAVVPAQHLRGVLCSFAPHARAGLPVVLCAKGIEQQSLKLPTGVLAETLPTSRPAVLSGPSFAAEVALGLPTAVTLAAADLALACELAEAIATPAFRPYVSDDMVGAEAGGAIKNVLAIACGIAEGRGLGRSAHAALVTRGFAELTRLAVALGGRAETVAGLCGLGDLVLTCSSARSRNFSLGAALGEGQKLDEALAGKLSVVEGVSSAPAVRDLARQLGVETPISDAVAQILAGEADVDQAIQGLLARPLKPEA